MDPIMRNVRQGLAAGRVLTGVMGFVFGGIGLTVLMFLWGTSSNEFGAPPLFFRIFGSFIALAFVAFGGTMGFSAFWSSLPGPAGQMEQILSSEPVTPPAPAAPSQTADSYVCTKCGAPLAKGVDVSPLGDVKCSFCGAWFNVHGRRA